MGGSPEANDTVATDWEQKLEDAGESAMTGLEILRASGGRMDNANGGKASEKWAKWETNQDADGSSTRLMALFLDVSASRWKDVAKVAREANHSSAVNMVCTVSKCWKHLYSKACHTVLMETINISYYYKRLYNNFFLKSWLKSEINFTSSSRPSKNKDTTSSMYHLILGQKKVSLCGTTSIWFTGDDTVMATRR